MRNDTKLGEAWFRPRRFGYGVTPISDEGVVASVAAFIALGICIRMPTMLLGRSLLAVVVSVVSFTIVHGVFAFIAHKHTDYSL